MQLPIKAHYATLAMLALADKYQSREVLPARIIAREHGIPCQFLTQILQQLRAAGLICSTRGANGGFYLNQSPGSIGVGEIVNAVCPQTSNSSVDRTSPWCELVLEVWDDVKAQQREVLDRLSLADLLARCGESSNSMFYI